MTTYTHSSVSIEYLENRLEAHAPIRVRDTESGKVYQLQRETVQRWKAQNYAFAPPCDNVTPDGRCAGHEKED